MKYGPNLAIFSVTPSDLTVLFTWQDRVSFLYRISLHRFTVRDANSGSGRAIRRVPWVAVPQSNVPFEENPKTKQKMVLAHLSIGQNRLCY